LLRFPFNLLVSFREFPPLPVKVGRQSSVQKRELLGNVDPREEFLRHIAATIRVGKNHFHDLASAAQRRRMHLQARKRGAVGSFLSWLLMVSSIQFTVYGISSAEHELVRPTARPAAAVLLPRWLGGGPDRQIQTKAGATPLITKGAETLVPPKATALPSGRRPMMLTPAPRMPRPCDRRCAQSVAKA
jgi:hypothetical protein